MTDEVLFRVEDRVAVITLNRPDSLNAMSIPLLEQLLATLERCASDDDIGCVVLTGAGRAFCAGGDVKGQVAATDGSAPKRASVEEASAELCRLAQSSRLLHEMPKPTICMLNGVAAGAGMSVALACDLRIAAASARMTTAFAKVGFSGDFGGTWFLSRLVGPAKARELYFTSDVLNGAQLEALGLVNRLVEDAALEAETMALAKRLAAGPRLALASMKKNFSMAETATLADFLPVESLGQTTTGRTEDHKEAARAFVEKRPPVFVGR